MPTLHLSGDYVPGEVLIKVDVASPLAELGAYLNAIDADIISEITELGIIQVQASGFSVQKLVAEIDSMSGVVYVEPNYRTRLLETTPNDPGWSNQYGLVNIRAPYGWDLATGSAAVTIAVLDTGVDLSHPDLSAKITSGFDFVENDTDPQDDNGHGTHVAGIAAATTNNSTGVAGASWGAQVMPIKILNRYGSGSYSDLAAAVIWAADHGADVINMSLGGGSPSSILEDAVNYAYARGVVQVAAAGNTGSGYILYPARYTHVIAVGATDANDNRASFSNYGAELDLVAPGVSIYSTRLGSSYGYRNGTSMSTPYVSGLAAILTGLSRPYSPDLIAYEMQSTALDLGATGWDTFCGHGLIQMDAALAGALPTATPTTVPGGQREPEDSEDSGDSEELQSVTPTGENFILGQGMFSFTSTSTPTPSRTATSTMTITPADSLINLLSVTDTNTPTTTPSPKPSPAFTVISSDHAIQKKSPALIILGVSLLLISFLMIGYGLVLRRLNQTE
jgi:thermitase